MENERNLKEQCKKSAIEVAKEVTKELIKEHKELNSRIETLKCFVYNINNELLIIDNKTQSEAKKDCLEYVNLAIQLRGMKMYRDALTARLLNRGIIIKDGHYMTEVE